MGAVTWAPSPQYSHAALISVSDCSSSRFRTCSLQVSHCFFKQLRLAAAGALKHVAVCSRPFNETCDSRLVKSVPKRIGLFHCHHTTFSVRNCRSEQTKLHAGGSSSASILEEGNLHSEPSFHHPSRDAESFSSNSKQKQLPHGLLIQYVSKDDVQFLYDEIWRDRSYLQHGVAIGPGDTVIDVGANIGLFALQTARECPGGRVLAFEPIPRVFEALQRNVAVNAQGPSFAKVEVLNAGLSNGQLSQAEFTFYEQAAGWSTMCEDKAEVEAAMDIFLSRALATGEGLGNNKMAPIGKWLQQRAPPALFKLLARLYVSRMVSRATKVTCPLYTLSQVLKAHGISRVDLLKIDVERAELEVLNGIEQSDWSKIKQVVMEVHNTDKRLEKVTSILGSAGFEDTVIQQSKSLKDSTLYNVYAKRPANSALRQ